MGNRQRLERDSLLSSMADRAAQYQTLETQFIQLRDSFQTIVNLDGFTGLGASSIKRFFQAQIDVVDAWLMFIEVQMTFLNDIPQMLADHDLATESFVDVSFLDNDLQNAYYQVNEMVESQKKGLDGILQSIHDILPMQGFSRKDFDEQIDQSDRDRKSLIEDVETLDARLRYEYDLSEELQNQVIGLFSEILNATEQAGSISPINFNADTYKNSATYQFKDDMSANRSAYLALKALQNQDRQGQDTPPLTENKEWYEKATGTVSVFTGERNGFYDYLKRKEGIDPLTGESRTKADQMKDATFAAAGFIPTEGWAGSGANAHRTLDLYKDADTFSMLRQTDYGIYGLASDNGFSEYITGKDENGEILSEDKRQHSLSKGLSMFNHGA